VILFTHFHVDHSADFPALIFSSWFDPSVIGQIAQEAHVKRLVLSHRMLRTLGKEEQSESEIRKSFSGPVAFANDLDCFPVP
jgi:ribonuclease BN (tRNA processing enzyme)